ncbi:Histidine kinase domain-containing protein [Sulfidibacter corallicola]|uniref:histidine kinase n=1 Tax=Sulfidibacter corallicola TaxID=2818388 RepID=A0A8A4TRR5_SULCO|nr:sensor histidine kinase [Sulfidibacter corallicola]QTD52240.1 hypothetical protein J3U87_07180 [Sulfidibacter corallicola]
MNLVMSNSGSARWSGLFVAVWAWCALQPLWGQPRASWSVPFDELRFTGISTEQGLSQSTVYALLQDREGFIWIGTEDGLNRYDGYSFRQYRLTLDTTDGLSHNTVLCLVEDREGHMWIGTDHGLNRYDSDRNRFESFFSDPDDSETISHPSVSALALDEDGEIWLTTFRGGLDHVDPRTGAARRFGVPEALRANQNTNWSRAVATQGNRYVWIGTSRGLHRLDRASGAWLSYRHDPGDPTSLSNEGVRAIHVTGKGDIWVGTSDGLHRMLPDGRGFHRFQAEDDLGLSDDWVNIISEGPKGRLWIGTRSGGLARFDADRRRFTSFTPDPLDPFSIKTDNILSLLFDRSGVMWVGGYLGGLSKSEVDPMPFHLYRSSPTESGGLTNNRVRSIIHDREGAVWVGTLSGLNRMAPGANRFEHLFHDPKDPDSLSENQVMSIAEDGRGQLWFGTYYGGVQRWLPEKRGFAHYRHDPDDPRSLSHDVVSVLTVDRDGLLWLGTRNGVCRFLPESERFQRFLPKPNDPEGLGGPEAYYLYPHSDGTVWVGLVSDGLNVLHPEKGVIARYGHERDDLRTLSNASVTSILEDREGRVWVGTENGLNRHEGDGRFQRFTADFGLPNANIRSMLLGDGSELWLATNKGLLRWDTHDNSFQSYQFEDGLQGNEFILRSAFRADDGRLYFGGLRGLTAFYPSQIIKRPGTPPIVLTAFKVFSDERWLYRANDAYVPISLRHAENFFSFDFAALDYRHPEKNRYAYRLEGFDRTWIHTDGDHSAHYTNVQPGSYVFRVRGTSSDGTWNELGTGLSLTIQPPFWHKPWFRSLVVLSALASMVGGIQWRLLAIKRHNRKLAQLVRQRTAELEMARGKMLHMAREAGVAEVTAGVVHNIGNLVNSLSVSGEQLVSLLDRSSRGRLTRVNALLDEQRDRLEAWLAEGKAGDLCRYLKQIESALEREDVAVRHELERIQNAIGLVRNEILSQREYIGAAAVVQPVEMGELMEEALGPFRKAFEVLGIEVDVRVHDEGAVQVPKARLLHALTQIIHNAEEAMMNQTGPGKRIAIEVQRDREGEDLVVRVSDSGPGVPETLREKIFQFGFSTKSNSHGSGLHHAANTLREIGGELVLEPAGNFGGATFRIRLPVEPPREEL